MFTWLPERSTVVVCLGILGKCVSPPPLHSTLTLYFLSNDNAVDDDDSS